jgi:hypothetical protein
MDLPTPRMLQNPAFSVLVAAVVRRLANRFDKLKAGGVTTAATTKPEQAWEYRPRGESKSSERSARSMDFKSVRCSPGYSLHLQKFRRVQPFQRGNGE